MILPDINVWVALSIADHRHHSAAAAWFDTVDEPGSVRFCRVTQHGLLRLLTRSAVMGAYGVTALTNEQAWQLYDTLGSDDRVGALIAEPREAEGRWRELSSPSSQPPQLWTASYLAAFAISAGLTFVTIDRAFEQFGELDLVVIDGA